MNTWIRIQYGVRVGLLVLIAIAAALLFVGCATTQEVDITKFAACDVEMPAKPSAWAAKPGTAALPHSGKLDVIFGDYKDLEAYAIELERRLESCRKIPE